MKFDPEGHIDISPKDLYRLAVDCPCFLVDHFLTVGTPLAFEKHAEYCKFLDAVAERIGVHPRNMFMRGSCHLGYSLAPQPKVWTAMSDDSDLDLAIVDAEYFERMDKEIQRWEQTNVNEFLQGAPSRHYLDRQRYRKFNCCAETVLPPATCIHHVNTMQRIAAMEHSRRRRTVSAFVFRDWFSARGRCEFDLAKLHEGIQSGKLTPPGDSPLPPERKSHRADEKGVLSEQGAKS